MKAETIDEQIVDKVQAAAALDGVANWVPVMEHDELEALAEKIEGVAGGLVGAASRLRRLAKQKKKGGNAAHHIKK